MNENHQRVCPSPEWAAYLHGEVLPSLAELADLGGDVLEIGPGPGAATEWLRHRVARLVALEVDEEAARALEKRFSGDDVEVVVGDATALRFADASFDAVGSFTMLHHVPTLELQRAILSEAFRVLRPGGSLVGSDSLASVPLHDFHEGDTYNPIDPAILLVLLRAIGFDELTVRVGHGLAFAARKPAGDRSGADDEGAPDHEDARDDKEGAVLR